MAARSPHTWAFVRGSLLLLSSFDLLSVLPSASAEAMREEGRWSEAIKSPRPILASARRRKTFTGGEEGTADPSSSG